MTEAERQAQIETLNQTPLSLAAKKQIKNEDWFGLAIESYLMQELREALESDPDKYWTFVEKQAIELLESIQISSRYSPQQRYEFLTTNMELPEEDREAITSPDFEEMLYCLKSWFNLEPEFPELL